MKHHSNGRPIGKCKGCCLNLKTLCAAGAHPRDEWSRGRCRYMNDRALLAAYEHPDPLTGAKAARARRQVLAAREATRPRRNGVLVTPARRGGRARALG